MYSFKCSGKTISEAIEKGLKQLKLTNQDVDIVILQNAGFLKSAKVLLKIPDEIENTNEEIIRLKKLDLIEEKIKKEEQKIFETTDQKNALIQSINQDFLDQNSLDNIAKDDYITLAKMFVLGLIKNAKYEVKNIDCEETENDIIIKIYGDSIGKLIGKNGETLSAIQYLINVYLSKYSHKTKRVILDINNYKQNRNTTLENLAHTLAKKVQETEKIVQTRPMNSYERRIIHNVISNYPELETISEGIEPNRYIKIKLKS